MHMAQKRSSESRASLEEALAGHMLHCTLPENCSPALGGSRLTCTRLRDHSSLSPAASCLSSARAVASGVRFCLRMSLARSPPEQYSMTRNIMPFSCGHRLHAHDASEVAHSLLQTFAGGLLGGYHIPGAEFEELPRYSQLPSTVERCAGIHMTTEAVAKTTYIFRKPVPFMKASCEAPCTLTGSKVFRAGGFARIRGVSPL